MLHVCVVGVMRSPFDLIILCAFVCLARSTELEDDVTADHGVLDFESLLTYITPDDDPVFPALYTMAQAAVPVVKHLNGDTSWLISFPVSTQDREDGLFNVCLFS
ncbi:hypothetical protein FRC12_006216 [Ceratobasidium sp. 428]|nr:hypothetical protein FRC12_006216 [Ceratobasidium sp. 428]